MRWIISNDKDIAGDIVQKQARRNYIQLVAGAEVSTWKSIEVNGQLYFYCTSNDGIDGTFITAHFDDVVRLCTVREICSGKIVVANTCILRRILGKEILFQMMRINRAVELFFAKQELSLGIGGIFWQSTTLAEVAEFGFPTSLSERKLFKNRSKGLMEAIRLSFDRISPVILPGEFRSGL